MACVVIVGASAWAPQVDAEAGVYSALFTGDYPSLKPLSDLVVMDATIPMPTLAGSATEWLRQFEDVPPALRRAANQLNPTKVRPLAATLLPRGAKLVSERAIQAIFTGGTEENWAAFRRHLVAEGWVAFSEVIFTEDRLDALVYYEGRCGGLCGEGGYVWVHRGSPGSPWLIRKKILSWVS